MEHMLRLPIAHFLPSLLLCALLAPGLSAQTQKTSLLVPAPEQAAFWKSIQGFKPKPIENQGGTASFQLDSLFSPDSFCLQLIQYFQENAYLLASIDTSSRPYSLALGPAMRWVSLRPAAGLEQEIWRSSAGIKASGWEGKPLRHTAVLKLEQALLEQAENNGYPFAEVWLDSVRIDSGGQVSAIIQLDKKRYFAFKALKINGDIKLPKAYLPNYLGIRTGSPYSRARVLRLRDQLRSLVFLESSANPTVTFAGNPNAETGEASIQLFLKKKRASRFDFLLGLLPQPNTPNGKLLLTGSLSAAFQNALNLGERFSAELERLRPETQKIDVQGSVPYILGSSFGAEGRLGIFRRDSTWTDAQGEAGVSYLFSGADFVRFFWENKSSSLQKVDTLAVLSTRRLPANLDYRQNGFGLEASFSRLDYRFNPRRGWSVVLKAVAGFNTLQRNTQIENLRDAADPGFSFSTLYDSLTGKAARYRAELRTEIFVPVFLRSTLKIGVRGGGIFSEKTIFANENYRLGGNKLLRGFDEESLFATRFVVSTLEYRLLLGTNSYLSTFADWAYLENVAAGARVFLRPLGLGAGINFETRAGIFGISAAVGRRDVGQSVDIRATKFHIGYVSLF